MPFVWKKLTFYTVFLLSGLGTTTMSDALDLGNLKTGHVAVVAPNIQQSPRLFGTYSQVEKEIWTNTLAKVIEKHFRKYDSGQLHHLGISIEKTSLVRPQIAASESPKSSLQILVTLWIDETQSKVNHTPKEFRLAFKITSGGKIAKEKDQIEALGEAAAVLIEEWIAGI